MKVNYKIILNECKDKCPNIKGVFVDDCNICIKKQFLKYYNENKIDIKKFINKLLSKLDKHSKKELLNYTAIETKSISSINEIKNKKIYLLAISLQVINKTFLDLKFQI